MNQGAKDSHAGGAEALPQKRRCPARLSPGLFLQA